MDFRSKFDEVNELQSEDFKILAEKVEVDSDYIGITGYGDIITVNVKRAEHNELMLVEVTGGKILTKIKSADRIKGEYKEEDWNVIEKIYAKATKDASVHIKKAITEFEKNLANAFKTLEIATNKL